MLKLKRVGRKIIFSQTRKLQNKPFFKLNVFARFYMPSQDQAKRLLATRFFFYLRREREAQKEGRCDVLAKQIKMNGSTACLT